MKTYYVIRSGWNAANQSSMRSCANPKNNFESNLYALVGIVEAASEQEAIEKVNVTCYNGQSIWCETNPRAIKGLTSEIREFSVQVDQLEIYDNEFDEDAYWDNLAREELGETC